MAARHATNAGGWVFLKVRGSMIRNVTYNNPQVEREVNAAIGKAYGLMQRLKLRGTGSPKLLVVEASEHFGEYLSATNDLNYCQLELRPEGLLLRFRYLLETMAWVLPMDALEWTHRPARVTLTCGDAWMVLEPVGRDEGSTVAFLRKCEREWRAGIGG